VGFAILLGFVLKLSACCGQYLIGYKAGQRIEIQQLIGVDQVGTRAIEEILKRRGLNWGKIAVLVGGPDWPVSVTCGILKVNVCQMLLGTVPVIFVLSPCVLAGAYMSKSKPGTPSNESMLAALFVSLSALGQGASMFEATRTITNVILEKGEELEKPRPEHEAVRQKNRDEQTFNDWYDETLCWYNLGCFDRAIIILATGSIYISGCMFAFIGSKCFENFDVSGKVSEDIDNYGLGGDVLHVVKTPVGWIALILFFGGVVLHVLFVMKTGRYARSEFASGKRAGGNNEEHLKTKDMLY